MIDGVTPLRSMIHPLYVLCTSNMVVHFRVVCVYVVIVIPCNFLLLLTCTLITVLDYEDGLLIM